MIRFLAIWLLAFLLHCGGELCAVATAADRAAGGVRFSRDILPILSDNCLSCHGPDEANRKGGLRLDLRESAVAVREGVRAVVPGDPAGSELLKRVMTHDEEDLMPPAKSLKPRLTGAQVGVLRQWISEGAEWGRHWAFERPVREVPPPGHAHPVDAFVRTRLLTEGLKPSGPASKSTLLRRLSWDLTGLPPTLQELEAFERDRAPDAVGRVVRRLLDSPHYGERMAMWWLDVARYADTDGFQADDTRTNWPWRDWVVSAFNANMPFDRFTVEQFGGDLLEGATPDQILATAFHRHHMTNGEGGRDPEESRVDYVIDRVNTMGTAWLGLTLGCCQCHSHKFDPISQADYYGLSAFFNSIDEDGRAGGGARPFLPYQSRFVEGPVAETGRLVEERRLVELRARREAEVPFASWLNGVKAGLRPGHTAWTPLMATALESSEGTQLQQEPDGVIAASGPNPNQDDYRVVMTPRGGPITGLRLEVFPHATHTGGAFSRGRSGEFILTDIKVQVRRVGSSQVRDVGVSSAVADFSAEQKGDRVYGDIKGVLDDDPRNGWTTKGATNLQPHRAVFSLASPLALEEGETLVFELRFRSTLGDANLGRFRLSWTGEPGEAVRTVGPTPREELARVEPRGGSEPEAGLRSRLMEQFLVDHGPYRAAKESLDKALRQEAELKKAAARQNVMVLAERKEPRDTFVLVRGVWDKHGDKVVRGGLPSVAPWREDEPRTRLGLGRWLVSRDNPLTARVLVNHLWQMFFGAGLVRTPEDFGLQGERPTHPELLDWLAVEFMESGWDVKHLVERIVTSATYGQDSAADAAAHARDPENRWLARGARFRLPSWMLRDGALRVAGLLNPAVGGPPVRPYQPDGVWEEMFMGRFRYEPSEGPAQHRRTLYAFWRRAIAPTFLFDSAQRRVCEVRVQRTNTPLQALALLNDPTYLEAARELAVDAVLGRGGARPELRLQAMVRRVLSRGAGARELVVLRRELDRALAHYRANPMDAERLLRRGQQPVPPGAASAEVASYMVVASLLLNLDEAITHE